MVFREKIFSKFKGAKVVSPLDKLNKTREKLEKKENLLTEKASQEVVNATRAKDESAAIRCLKTKKLCEQQIEEIGRLKLRIDDQTIMWEGGEAAAWTVDALKSAAAATKAVCIRDVDNVIYDIDEQNESVKQMIEAVSAPSGAAALFDEDELKEELAELKRAEQDLTNL